MSFYLQLQKYDKKRSDLLKTCMLLFLAGVTTDKNPYPHDDENHSKSLYPGHLRNHHGSDMNAHDMDLLHWHCQEQETLRLAVKSVSSYAYESSEFRQITSSNDKWNVFTLGLRGQLNLTFLFVAANCF